MSAFRSATSALERPQCRRIRNVAFGIGKTQNSLSLPVTRLARHLARGASIQVRASLKHACDAARVEANMDTLAAARRRRMELDGYPFIRIYGYADKRISVQKDQRFFTFLHALKSGYLRP